MDNDIASQLLHCTVRVDTNDVQGRMLAGTGFLVEDTRVSRPNAFLVTNRHVVKNAEHAQLTFLRRTDKYEPIVPSKEVIKIQNFKDKFAYHDNLHIDVAVMPFGEIQSVVEKHGQQIFYRSIPTEIFLNERSVKTLSVIEDVIFIGYPRMLRDSRSLSPITRQGITATAIDQNFEAMPMFLIDGSIFEGSSGSPVFLLNRGMYPTSTGFSMGNRVIFLGVLAKLVSGTNTRLSVHSTGTPSSFFKAGLADMVKKNPNLTQYINIGVVFKTETIIDIINKIYKIHNIEPEIINQRNHPSF